MDDDFSAGTSGGAVGEWLDWLMTSVQEHQVELWTSVPDHCAYGLDRAVTCVSIIDP